ncbi:MAG: HD domain-containing protein [Firmicutes bacterium]|nr:HD domain-containing protein [Bacillota bacterium]
MNSILDNVHGFIQLTEVEDEIEKLPIFKRLQHIKQLGLANWIFPGAEHTRYIHSLGVMHIIDQMALKLKFSDEDRQLVRLAGMLHDIGHYPLSHIGEYAYQSNTLELDDVLLTSKQNVLDQVDKFKSKDILKSITMEGPSNPYHHENMGVRVIRNSIEIQQLISKHCPFINVEDICDIITGNTARLQDNPNLASRIQLLHSELDADRMDYLLRDATFSGASYGTFELGNLIKNLKNKSHSKLGIDIVGVSPKGIGAADQFLVNRYLAYSQVIFHKHVAILGYMAQTVMMWMIQEKAVQFPDHDTLISYVENHEKNTQFQKFTDLYFIKMLYEISPGDTGCPNHIMTMIETLKKLKALDMNEQVAFSGSSYSSIQEGFKETGVYRRISSGNYQEQRKIPLFSSISVTNNVPTEEFIEEYKEHIPPNGDDMPEIEYYLIGRLLNGLAIIEDDKEPYLLVDAPCSLVKDLYKNVQVFLREYNLE